MVIVKLVASPHAENRWVASGLEAELGTVNGTNEIDSL
jgi:hypothetical protein